MFDIFRCRSGTVPDICIVVLIKCLWLCKITQNKFFFLFFFLVKMSVCGFWLKKGQYALDDAVSSIHRFSST